MTNSERDLLPAVWKVWNKGQKCTSWVSYPSSGSVWIRLTDSACLPRAPGEVLKSSLQQAGSVALLLPAGKLRQHRELLFRQMFSCCAVLEPGRMLLLLLGCCLAQRPAFLWVNPSLPAPGCLLRRRWGAHCLLGPRPGMQFEAFPSCLFSG